MIRTATVFTHRRADETAASLREVVAAARRASVTLRFDEDETRKHGLEADECVETGVPASRDTDLCIVLGGDGTILSALRHYASTKTPVFAVNFGQVGFLATVDPNGLDAHLDRAFRGQFETLPLPAIQMLRSGEDWTAINDVSMHRKHGARVASLSYLVGGEEVGRVRCDGLVVSTPAGSTGYNLANGGPVLAWGVEGFVVSFIAPHSLTARALVVAPNDVLTVINESREEPVEVHLDGRPRCDLGPEEAIDVTYARGVALLAQMPGASFYHRLRERFGRLAA